MEGTQRTKCDKKKTTLVVDVARASTINGVDVPAGDDGDDSLITSNREASEYIWSALRLIPITKRRRRMPCGEDVDYNKINER